MKEETKKNILNSLIYFIKTFFFLSCYIGFCVIVVQLGIWITKKAIILVEYIFKIK